MLTQNICTNRTTNDELKIILQIKRVKYYEYTLHDTCSSIARGQQD